ncbi:MAG TPA: hypothetical protein PL076_07715 [Bacillota bacterium]|nr:hypothetical protein [Bacillota bacterium]HQJ36373.1 hypothetical protein [Bacillota bacterium]
MEGILVDIAVRCDCNYNCYYCVGCNKKETLNQIDLRKLEDRLRSFDTFVVSTLECGASEPSLHPQIKDLIRLCANYGAVVIVTNNSNAPERWIPIECAGKIFIVATVHPQADNEIDRFTDNILSLLSMGANVSVHYVGHPRRIIAKRIEELEKHFKSVGVSFSVTPFIGQYKGKYYPYSYTEEEKKFITVNSQYDEMRLEAGFGDFKGIPCLAGCRKVYINENGNMQRCLYDKTLIDSLYTEAKPCRTDYCVELSLEDLNYIDIRINNYKSRLFNLEVEEKPVRDNFKEEFLKLMKRYNKNPIQRYLGWEDTVRKGVLKFIEGNKECNVIIFGAGKNGEFVYKQLRDSALKNTNIRIIGFADNDEKKWDKEFCGAVVFRPEKGVLRKADKILIASSYYGEIYDQLVNLGIDKETIDIVSRD